MYLARQSENHLEYLSNHFPAVVITGARQTGKTTMIQNFFKDKNSKFSYVTLDHPKMRNLANDDPELFLQNYDTPLIIDEIQYAPNLLPFIKIAIDNNRAPGQYFLTGSQLFRMMNNVSESLAGRVGLLNLYAFSRAEINNTNEAPFCPPQNKICTQNETLKTVFNKIYRGSMPQMIIDKDLSPEVFFGEYMQTYIERDIREILKITNERKFYKFVSLMAARTSQQINMTDIARLVGIDSKTADKWLSLLVSSGIVYLLQPYYANITKRLVKTPKMYFMDTGLACYLSMWTNANALANSAMAGAMFETYVVSEIIKQYANAGLETRNRLSYYRDSNGKEIDLLIQKDATLFPVEIKLSANPKNDTIKNFNALADLPQKIGQGAIICLSSEKYPLTSKIEVLPLSML